MNTRRTFFKSLAKAAAIVALAPQLCFRARIEPVVEELDLVAMFSAVNRWPQSDHIEILTDRKTAAAFQNWFNENLAQYEKELNPGQFELT